MFDMMKTKIKKSLTQVDVVAEYIPMIEGHTLNDRVVLITGGSSGIGFGIAKSIIANGGKVIITGRNDERLKLSCSKLGNKAKYIVWDASSINQIDSKLKEAIDIYGYINVLVNNAGYHGNQNFFSINEEDYDRTFNTNLKNVFFLSQAFGKYFIDNNIKGNILNITSAASIKPAWSPYEISKWGVRGFTRGLARELAPYGITVNAIAPGPTATAMSNWNENKSISWPQIPLSRMILPEEIGNLAVFLISDMGRGILGETIFCDGGSGLLTMNK